MRDEIKDLRLRTLNDDLQRRNIQMNQMNKVHFQSKQLATAKSSVNNSSNNSRKSSLAGKEQFWQTLKSYIPSKNSNVGKWMGK